MATRKTFDGKSYARNPFPRTLGEVILSLALCFAFARCAPAMTFDELVSALDNAEPCSTVYVNSDVECPEALSVDKELTLRSSPGSVFKLVRSGDKPAVIAATNAACNLTIRDLAIDGNVAKGSYAGYVVSVMSGTVTLEDGAVVANGRGCGVNVGDKGVVNMMAGSVISNFTVGTSNYGIAVRVGHNGSGYGTYGTFNMQGGLITGCSGRANPSTENGRGEWDGAVYMYGGTFNGTGGTITGNRSARCVAGFVAYAGKVRLSGCFTATNNIGGFANDMYFDTNRTSASELKMVGDYTGKMTFKYTAAPSEGDEPHFMWTSTAHSRLHGWENCVSEDDPSLALDYWNLKDAWYPTWRRVNARIAGKGNAFTVQDAINAAAAGDTVEICRDQTVMETLSVTNEVTICSAQDGPYCMRRGVADVELVEAKNESVRIENVVLDGMGINPTKVCALVRASKGSTLVLGNGTVLRNGRCSAYGAAAVVRGEGSRLVMEDGSLITGCSSTNTAPYGAAVLIGEGTVYAVPPTFEMRGGSITHCDSSSNTSSIDSYGGIVYVWNGVFDMSGGAITNNRGYAQSSAAVVNYIGTVRMSGDAIIADNDGSRPGIYNCSKGNTVYYGDFRGCTAISNGSQNPGNAIAAVSREGEASGAWCFVSKNGACVGWFDGEKTVWAEPVGSVGGVAAATVGDLRLILPTELDLGQESVRSTLPIVLSGAAAAFSGAIALSFDKDELLDGGAMPLVLLKAADGQTLTGTWTWSFSVPPRDSKGLFAVHDTSVGYVLEWFKHGTTILLR